jgi:dihydroorotase
MTDLLLKGGRVIDPSQGIDKLADVAFANGRVAAIGANLTAGPGTKVRDVKGLLVTPGLVDLHTHVYWGGTSLGVEATEVARRSGVTTCIDAGSAGPGNFHGFRHHVIQPSPVRILAYLNLSFAGIYAFSSTVMIGECADINLLDLRECRRVAEANRDLVVGIKVRVGRHASAASGIAPLDMALEVAEEAGLPVMCHLDYPPPSRKDVLTRLRKGDVLTHCFRPFPNAPSAPGGGVRDEVLAARERGVIFDIGHGGGSFGFGTTRAMLDAGFLPDSISSDVHCISIEGPAYDLLVTMSKFLCLGVDLPTVIRAATVAPAAAVGRSDLGTLKVGSLGDASVIALEQGEFTYRDVLGEVLKGNQKLAPRGIVIDGAWWEPGEVRRP